MTPEALRQMAEQIDEKHEEGHGRLRRDIRVLEQDMATVRSMMATHGARMDGLDHALVRVSTAPTEISRIHFTPGIVASIVTVCLAISGGMWASTYGLRSDVRDILTQQNEQQKVDVANATLNAERAAMLRQTVDMIEKKQELQRLEIQSLRETILRQRSTP